MVNRRNQIAHGDADAINTLADANLYVSQTERIAEVFDKLLFDESNHRLIGGGIVGTHAGDLIGEICLAVEMGCDPVDIGKTIHPHPTLSESIGMAAEVFEGVCTDLPPTKRK